MATRTSCEMSSGSVARLSDKRIVVIVSRNAPSVSPLAKRAEARSEKSPAACFSPVKCGISAEKPFS